MLEKLKIILFGKQPVSSISSFQLNSLVKREFPRNSALVFKKLDLIQSDTKNGKNRISAAVLRLTKRDITKLDELIEKANIDFRDIVSAAEYSKSLKHGFDDIEEAKRKQNNLDDYENYSE